MTSDGRIARVFSEVLQHSSPGFALGERLAAQFPERYLLESDQSCDVQSFAKAGHCAVEPRPGLYHQHDTRWSPDHGVSRTPACAWFTVTWESTAFEVVSLEWIGLFRPMSRQYIVGPNRDRTEAFFAVLSKWNHEVRGEILVFTEGCFSKSAKLYDSIQAASFDQLVLEGNFKQQIRDDFKQFLASRPTYDEAGVAWRRGALLLGPPGNGKTLCVKALVRELGLPCLYIQSFSAQHSTPQHAIDTVFRRARGQAPCIMVLEDIDALLTEGTRSFFLNELDGFASNTGVITIATTNHPERLDPSIVERPSRFDRKYHFELPSSAARAEYVVLWNDRMRPQLRLSEAGRAQIVDLTQGFSFAYIQEVFVSAAMHWMSSRDAAGLLPTAIEQIGVLRAQMTRTSAR